MNKTETENKEKGKAKRKFGLGGFNSQGNRSFKRFKPWMR